jgi:hypothetical protein
LPLFISAAKKKLLGRKNILGGGSIPLPLTPLPMKTGESTVGEINVIGL